MCVDQRDFGPCNVMERFSSFNIRAQNARNHHPIPPGFPTIPALRESLMLFELPRKLFLDDT